MFCEIVGRQQQLRHTRARGLNAEEASGGRPVARMLLRHESLKLRSRDSRRSLLFDLYERWGGRRPGHADRWCQLIARDQLRDVQSIEVEPERSVCASLSPDAVARVRDYNLDVLIRWLQHSSG